MIVVGKDPEIWRLQIISLSKESSVARRLWRVFHFNLLTSSPKIEVPEYLTLDKELPSDVITTYVLCSDDERIYTSDELIPKVTAVLDKLEKDKVFGSIVLSINTDAKTPDLLERLKRYKSIAYIDYEIISCNLRLALSPMGEEFDMMCAKVLPSIMIGGQLFTSSNFHYTITSRVFTNAKPVLVDNFSFAFLHECEEALKSNVKNTIALYKEKAAKQGVALENLDSHISLMLAKLV